MSIFVEKPGEKDRGFGVRSRGVERYSLKYFLYFCYKNLQTRIFFVRPVREARGMAGGLVWPGSVKNIRH
jgi:hypothetical protein